MIRTKQDFREYLCKDALANGRSSVRAHFLSDLTWKYIVSLRTLELLSNYSGLKRLFVMPSWLFHKFRYHNLSVKCGYQIPLHAFDKGLSIAHLGTIVVNDNAHIGQNCRIHEGVTIGANKGTSEAPTIGANCFIASGAKILGAIVIADDVAIGANAVVVKSITESGTTWAGVPARKISDNNSHKYFPSQMGLE